MERGPSRETPINGHWDKPRTHSAMKVIPVGPHRETGMPTQVDTDRPPHTVRHIDTPLVMTARHRRLRSMIRLVTYHSGAVTQRPSGILTPMVTPPTPGVTSMHRDGAGDDPQRQQAASTDTPETQGTRKGATQTCRATFRETVLHGVRHADERTRESGKNPGSCSGVSPYLVPSPPHPGVWGREPDCTFSPSHREEGQAPLSALCWREAPISRPPQPLGPAGETVRHSPSFPCACTSRAQDRNQEDQKGQAPRGLEMEANGSTLITRETLLPATVARPSPAHTRNAYWTLSSALIGSRTGIPSP